jgi:hypothetical protein
MPTISAQFTADFSQYISAAGGATDALGNVKAAAEGIAIDRQAERAGVAIRDLGGKVKDFATEYIGAFADEEAATARLTVALQNAGTASAETVTAYADMATEFQRTTRYSDDAVTAAQTALTQIGKIGPEQMRPAIEAATNLAASLGIGLEEAATKMSRAIASGGTKLGDLKQHFSDVDIKGKSAADIIETFNSKFGGAAAADMDTTAGKLTNLTNQFDDFKGKVGEVLANALTPVLNWFASMPDWMQTTIVGIGLLGAAFAPIVIAIGAVVTAIGPLISLLGGAGLAGALAALVPFLLPAGAIIVGITAVYLAFKNWDKIVEICANVYNGVKTWLVDKFTAIVDWVQERIKAIIAAFQAMYMAVSGGSIVPDMIEAIGEEFAKLNTVMVRPVLNATSASAGAFAGLAMGATGGGGGGGGAAVTNHIYVNGTAEEVARQVAAEILRTVKYGTQLQA